MSRDYKNISNQNKAPNPVTSTILSFVTGLSLGLFIAFLVFLQYSNMNTGIETVDATDPEPIKTEQRGEAEKKTTPDKEESVPAPTFDFYKILPNKEINISEWVAEEKREFTIRGEADNGIYIFQVGSFKDHEAADQVKATLALLGIDADIQRVVINGQDIRHRVRIGPYQTPDELMEIRKRLEANNLNFMILKLKAEDNG